MNKKQLIENIAEECTFSKVQAKKALESFIGAVTTTLKKGEKVTLVGFGTFSIKRRKARKGRNPQTGKTMKIKAKSVPHFSSSESLKKIVKNKQPKK